MAPADSMVFLTNVARASDGRWLAALLGAEGITPELRRPMDGPNPLLSDIAVFVRSDQLDLARTLILGVSPAELGYPGEDHEPWGRRRRTWTIIAFAALAIVILAAVATIY
ncbi:MAG: hypothetical protein ABR925_07835 [Acidimicrobiales bacterium]|jgi:hypothetical protein